MKSSVTHMKSSGHDRRESHSSYRRSSSPEDRYTEQERSPRDRDYSDYSRSDYERSRRGYSYDDSMDSRSRDREKRRERDRDGDHRKRSRKSPSPERRSPDRGITQNSTQEEPTSKKKKDELDPLLTRTGGAYIPPAKLRMMQEQITDKNSLVDPEAVVFREPREGANMNPLTKVKLINELNEREVQLGVAEKVSWHSEYKDSAWIFLGGLPYELTEGDIICVFSQYGEIVNINLVRDKKTGKSKGFCFLCYEDQRSTILAVDNFNGIKIKGRTIRVNHVSNYRAPQESEDVDDVTRELQEKGCGVKTPPSSPPDVSEAEDVKLTKKHKRDKKEKKKKKKENEKAERQDQAELPSCSRSMTVTEKDEQHGSQRLSSKASERARKSEHRDKKESHSASPDGRSSHHGRAEERKESHSGSPDGRSSHHGRAEDPEWEAKKEKPKREHMSSSRREGEEKSRDKDRGRSSGTHSSRHSGHSEGRSHRSRSRSPDKSHRHKKHRHSRERESFHGSDRRHY